MNNNYPSTTNLNRQRQRMSCGAKETDGTSQNTCTHAHITILLYILESRTWVYVCVACMRSQLCAGVWYDEWHQNYNVISCFMISCITRISHTHTTTQKEWKKERERENTNKNLLNHICRKWRNEREPFLSVHSLMVCLLIKYKQ